MAKEYKKYCCTSCGPFVRVYKEFWTSESEGPYKVDLIQPMNHFSDVVDTIEIKKKPEGEPLEYNYCAHCKSMIGAEIPLVWGDHR
tara:strand:+ start:324 stop:581 length:258 start_codon:yes stop_codon:yes gene_type:complete